MEQEIWKDVVGYEGLYLVSNLGNVISIRRNIMMKQYKNELGYKTVGLTKDKKSKTCKVHRLVALAFIPLEEDKEYIDHINTITSDNRVVNLRWCTLKENSNNEKTLKNFSIARSKRIQTYGDNANSKKVKCIETEVEFDSQKSAEEYYQLACTSIKKYFSKKHYPYGIPSKKLGKRLNFKRIVGWTQT